MARKGVKIKGLSVIGKITGKIRSKLNQALGFKGKPPKPAPPNTRVIGHRGIAAGSLQERQRLAEEFYRGSGVAPYSAEEIARWQNLSGDEVYDFVNNETLLIVNSSNVASLQYFPTVQKLLVEFLNGKAYIYSDVSQAEALQFATYQSKGGAVWDLLRVRGSRTAHKKPYSRTSGKIIAKPKPPPPSDLPPFEQFL